LATIQENFETMAIHSSTLPLLSPRQVAELLQLSLATIYAKAHSLGGFYPAGIKALRFRTEMIYAIMEGPQNRKVSLPVSISGQKVQQDGVRHPKGRRKMDSGPADGIGAGSPDPTIAADAIRFGLRTPGSGEPKERTELMVLFSWAHKRHLVPTNPVILVDKLGVDQGKKVIPTPQEMNQILLAAGKDRPLLLVLFHTLARIDETRDTAA
jgi:hypothetical protein